jgi:predicted enzyme related to lactoylglutathione lyase
MSVSRAQRLLDLIQVLRRHRFPVSGASLAGELDVSLRTLYRDIEIVSDADAVRATHESWKGLGLKVAQAPTAMDFGVTFVALDPDGHRLRVFAPAVPA